MLENAYKVTSTSKFSTQNVQIPYHLHHALSYSLQKANQASTKTETLNIRTNYALLIATLRELMSQEFQKKISCLGDVRFRRMLRVGNRPARPNEPEGNQETS